METESVFANSPSPDEPGPARAMGPARRVAGGLLLAAGLVFSQALTVQHLGAIDLPGCGADGSCAQLAASALGRVGDIPVSVLGVAYFAALLTAWAVCGEGVALDVRVLARLGAIVSIILIGAMITLGHLCHFCLATHGVNLAFWALIERAPRLAGIRLATLGVAGAVFALTTGTLYSVDVRGRQASTAALEAQRSEANDRLAASVAKGPASKTSLKGPPVPTRYPLGPKDAEVQLVIYGDYQCPFCRNMDAEARKLVERYPGRISFAVKQYPLGSGCNPFFSNDFHPNACRAARVAEAAGALKGVDGFWKMHEWLCKRAGEFGDGDLSGALKEQGYDNPGAFIRTMDSQEMLDRIRQDIKEAAIFMDSGSTRIPIVVANGIMLQTPDGASDLTNAVEAVLK